MKSLLISGNTLQEWDLQEILSPRPKSKSQTITDMISEDWDNTISRCGLTYLEIELIDNKFNNFR